MTVPQSNTTTEPSLGREVFYATRYYLGNRWTLVAAAGLAVALGLSLGGWGWLVAAGLVPILLSTLPCLIMCGFGVCMMCRGQKRAAAPNDAADAADAATSATALGAVKLDRQAVAASSCCHADADESQATKPKQLQPIDERRDSHA